MKKYSDSNEAIFSISVEDLQHQAINITGRKLTDKELHIAVKGINVVSTRFLKLQLKKQQSHRKKNCSRIFS